MPRLLALVCCLTALASGVATARADAPVELASLPAAADPTDRAPAEAGSVDVEKSSFLLLSRFDAGREISGAHDTLGGQRLRFAVRRGRDGRVTARVTSGARAILRLEMGGGRALVWRFGGLDVPASSADETTRARLAAWMSTPDARAVVELARDLDSLVANSSDVRARELSALLLQAVLDEDGSSASYDPASSALAELRAARRVAPR